MEKSYDFLKKVKLRNAARKKIDEIERLKEEVKNNDYELLNTEIKISRLLTDSKYEKEYILHDILLKEIKLERLRISETTINIIKKSFIA